MSAIDYEKVARVLGLWETWDGTYAQPYTSKDLGTIAEITSDINILTPEVMRWCEAHEPKLSPCFEWFPYEKLWATSFSDSNESVAYGSGLHADLATAICLALLSTGGSG